MKYDAVAVGELLIDFACKSVDTDGYPTMSAQPGGAPANYLAALQKFGAQTAMIGKVGNDAFGKMLLGTLNRAGIDTTGISVSEDVFTTLAFVTFDEHNDREFSFSRKPGSDTCLTWEEVPTELLDNTRVLHFGTLSLTNEPARSATRQAVFYAREHGTLVSFDPNLRKPLWNNLEDAKAEMLWGLEQADVVKISDEEVEFLFPGKSFEEAAQLIREEYGVKLVYLTKGRDGCLVCNEKACVSVPGMTGLKVLDTTGAGDIFGGSAMWKFLQLGKAPEDLEAEELKAIGQFACTSAGLSTTKAGGIYSVPALEEIDP